MASAHAARASAAMRNSERVGNGITTGTRGARSLEGHVAVGQRPTPTALYTATLCHTTLQQGSGCPAAACARPHQGVCLGSVEPRRVDRPARLLHILLVPHVPSPVCLLGLQVAARVG